MLPVPSVFVWRITPVICWVINHNCIVLLLCSNNQKHCVFGINLLQMCSLCMCFSLCCEEVSRLQFGTLGGLGGGVGVKHEDVQHCGGVVWSVWARLSPIVAKPPNFSVVCARYARCAPPPPP